MSSTGSLELNDRIVALLRDELGLAQRPPRAIAANTVLVGDRDVAQNLYVLHSGQMHIEYYPASFEGTRVIPIGFGPGALLLMHRVYDNRWDPGALVATTDAEVHPIPCEEFRRVMHASVERLVLVTEFLAARLTETRVREGLWMERRVEERVAMTLARIASEQGLDRPGQAAHLSLTHELLADRCGLSRSRVSRELKRLEEEGLIRLGRNRVDLLDLQGLNPSGH